MSNYLANLEQLAARHAGDPRPGGRGRIIAFTSPSREGDHHEVVRRFALHQTTRTDRPIWLLDADFSANHHANSLRGDGLSHAYDAALREYPFWRVVGEGAPKNAGGLVTLHRHPSGLFVSYAHLRKLREGWTHAFCDARDYWRLARRFAHSIILDVPAPLIDGSGRALFQAADTTVIVVQNRNGQLASARALKIEIERAGGRCAGAILIEDGAQGLAA
jgi:hypothetical protein